MIIRWKCSCMLSEQTLEVKDREEGEDIVRWMNKWVRPAIGDAHFKMSPACLSRKLETPKIPMEPGRPIGGKPESTRH